ncbi:MAG: hypothetical protein A2Z99_21715 [Treponema sp. GWB1_62_6]|nr:MAG: hypothetical protein A2Z99_21715 [Treponema sp. GWB1_62_6]
MKMIMLGKTELRVSAMSLGCLYFGARDSREESFKRLDQYLGYGGNFLDTANMYSHWISDATRGGESESLLGEWLKARGCRSRVVIASKVGFPYPGVPYGTSAKRIKEECDKSLKRMGTDYIDLYFAHSDDRGTPMEESLGAFNELIKEGKVRNIGASNFKAWRLERAARISRQNGWAEYCCIQQRYSYLRPKAGWDFGVQVAANDDLLEYVTDTGMGLMAYSPLLYGAYTDPKKAFQEQYLGPDSDARLGVLSEVAAEIGATKNQVVYAWLMRGTPAAIPLVASTTDSQFGEAMGSLSIDLTADQMKRLSDARA